MDRRQRPPFSRVRTLAGCVLAALFVLAGASGDNLFARHVGMMTVAPVVVSAAAGDGGQAASSVGFGRDGEGLRGAGSDHGPGSENGSAQLLHLLGACLSILAVGILLWRRGGMWRDPTRLLRALPSRRLLVAHWKATARGSPPPLSPPRASPVIRT
jgi:hypothetical protein